jgi:uncharacterized membrane protein YbhN (UPF0104 family)
MNSRQPTSLPERPRYLVLLAASPTIWAAHFLLAYCTAAVWCEKVAPPGGGLGAAGVAIWIFTAAALAAVALTGWLAWRRHRYGNSELPHDFDSPADRHRFLGFACLLLSGLSAVAIGYSALALVLVGSCR